MPRKSQPYRNLKVILDVRTPSDGAHSCSVWAAPATCVPDLLCDNLLWDNLWDKPPVEKLDVRYGLGLGDDTCEVFRIFLHS